MDIAHIISSHFRFDLIEIYLLIKQILKCSICFDWSNNCGDFFRREIVKFILTILKRNISPAKL